MENSTEINGHQIDNNKKPNDSISEQNKSFLEHEKDVNKTSCNENSSTTNQSVSSTNTVPVSVNPVKTISSEASSLTSQPTQHSVGENGKLVHRRNTVPLPILKKPITNTTKPWLLPAPISDSFPQGTKTNIVTMHSNYATSSVSSQFNNCQQQMAMGIATIQPQHFGYPSLSNNRYPMMPISLQNSYSTQQLTIANGSLGTAVQLMPVMNQNNNQINNSRVQSLPLFMTPLIGTHSGMLFQPNMAIVPQSPNTMQTISIPPSSTYSNEYNPGIAVQSQPMYSSVRNTTVFTTDCETTNILKQDVESNKLPPPPAQTIDKSESENTSKTNKSVSELEPIVTVRTNVKHRELIRTQIYRMKLPVDESSIINITTLPESTPEQLVEPQPVTPEEVPLTIEENPIETEKPAEIIDNKSEAPKDDLPKSPEIQSVASKEIDDCEKSPPIITSIINEPDKKNATPIEPKPSAVISLPLKRKLPSPEILQDSEPAKKQAKTPIIDEKPDSVPKSPISLFEKLVRDNFDRPSSMFNNNNRQSNKLTAVVRPEQRKVLVHYLDDLIIFESDVPFPTTNKMQVVKSALKAGNIKLTSQKSKHFTDHFLYNNTDDEMSPNQPKHKLKQNHHQTVNVKTNRDTCMEPLSIDIPTTNTTSSCGSVDSSQVRPLSICSRQSPTPITTSTKKIVNQSPRKEIPVSSPKKDKIKKITIQEPKPIVTSEILPQPTPILTSSNKESIPVKQVSPVKQIQQKTGLDRPICEWSVNDVADFVRQTPGCENYVSMFQNHEIDGEALLLLSNENLIQGALNMKIGPALKLCARIDKRKALDPPQL